MPLELAIVLPTLNERDNLAPLIDRIAGALGPDGWEAMIVDDHSDDGTADAARALALADPRIRVIERIGRRGLASAAIEGMCATAAPFVAVMDADHQHDPALLRDMLAAVKDGAADIAVASRFVAGASADGLEGTRREELSGIANRIARRIIGTEISDPMSGFFLMQTSQLRALAPRLSGIGFKILLDILAVARPPLRIAEFPLQFGQRLSGESKLDSGVGLDFLVGLYERLLGRIIPTRFAMFGTVGALGVIVHFSAFSVLFYALLLGFALAQGLATFAAMSFNFWLNNRLTYRDKRLTGARALLTGWLGFCATCAVGALANIAVATLLEARGIHALLAAGAGIIVGAVWNYALSSKFVWGRY